MAQVTKDNTLIQLAQQVGFGVPAGDAIKSGPGGGLHVVAEKERMENNIAAARRQAVNHLTAYIINRNSSPVSLSLLLGAELGHKPLQVGGRCCGRLDGQP